MTKDEEIKMLRDTLKVAREALEKTMYSKCDCWTDDNQRIYRCIGHLTLSKIDGTLGKEN